MFNKTAKYYDEIYSFKDYGAEAASIRSIIQREHSRARSILDVGCGTGEHARRLSRDLEVDGIDIDPEFVSRAQSKSSNGTFVVADMREFQLPKTYDVVLCLFSSIGYLLRQSEVVQALRCFSGHLSPGGVVIVEPWFTPENWESAKPGMSPPVDLPGLKICRMHVSGRRDNVALLHFHYLIATPGGVEHIQEEHELALYSTEQMLDCFDRAGLRARYETGGLSGRGLYIARKN